jgi:uncharacterized protein YdaT
MVIIFFTSNFFLMGKNQHVVKHGKKWAVRGAGNNKVTQIFNTQKEAINKGKEICKNQGSELYIHGKDGKIRDKNSYGNDPYPPEG